MIKIAIVFHSGRGHTRALAKAIADGVTNSPGIDCKLIDVGNCSALPWEVLSQSNAIIFGSPTYMGNVSAPFKAFMDQTSEFWLKQPWKDKIAAGFTISTASSGDKLGTLSAIMLFAMQHGMIWLGQDHVGSMHTKDDLDLNESGSWLGLMARSNPDKDKLIFEGDKKTAIRFGQRIAALARKLYTGNCCYE